MRGSAKGHTTIIKRSSRKGHDAVHGGAWKVAFADFTLAMMALFMVLWIMGAVTEEERKEIVSLLNSDSLFDGMSGMPITQLNGSGGSVTVLAGKPKPDDASQAIQQDVAALQALTNAASQGESLEDVNRRSEQEIEDLARVIMKITSAYEAQSNLQIEIVPQGAAYSGAG